MDSPPNRRLNRQAGDSRTACGVACSHAASPLRESNRVRSPSPPRQKNIRPHKGALDFLAEKGGFEPPVRYKRTLAFQASALSHSATSPNSVISRLSAHSVASRGMGSLLVALASGWPGAAAFPVRAQGHQDRRGSRCVDLSLPTGSFSPRRSS